MMFHVHNLILQHPQLKMILPMNCFVMKNFRVPLSLFAMIQTSNLNFTLKNREIPQGAKMVKYWLRPSEFSPKPKLFIDGSSSGDVKQGFE
jgi:hypothetical protein